MKSRFAGLVSMLAVTAGPVWARDLPDPAAAFGARESVQAIALSPDGRRLVYVEPTRGQGADLFTVDLERSETRRAAAADGVNQRFSGCEFVSNQRLVCTIFALGNVDGQVLPMSRLIAVNADGSDVRVLGERDSANQLYYRSFTGSVIDYTPGTDGEVLMMQTFVPESVVGSRFGRRGKGLGVVRLDTGTLRSSTVEQPRDDVIRYISDGRGKVRLIATREVRTESGYDSPIRTYHYRRKASDDWHVFGRHDTASGKGAIPVAVDPELDVAYVFDALDGRSAVYRVALDGSLRRELVVKHDQVDSDGLLRIGRRNRVVGASFATDRREVVYFDAELKRIAERLKRALPDLPLIQFVDSSEDEQRLLIWAGSDKDPGRYYTYDKPTQRLSEIMLARPQLENVPLAAVKPITYRAADGTQIPGYLTLPPGSSGRGLPAIVMPHGGPSARDEWGFDWLAQYFAHRGYAVLQPNFRGSAGYGEAWFQSNGFRSWRTAIGDVNDAGRWLVSEGIADPAKLGIVGWSYGGYAALQSAVVDPKLFKAVVAVAPVTDLKSARDEWRGFTNAANVREFFGDGPHITQGSPAQNAPAITAPVLMFHGDLDRNVGIRQSRIMQERLRSAGKRSELIVYPGLDHQLDDSTARADMLRRSDAFLREVMGIR